MPGHEILNRGTAAAVGHELKAGPYLLLEVGPDDLINSAGADHGN